MKNTGQRPEFHHISQITYDVMCEVENIYQNNDKIMGIGTGIEYVDDEIRGINKGDLVLIGNYPLSYKGFFISNFIAKAAEQFKKRENLDNKNVLYFTLDYTAKHIAKSLICIKNGLPHNCFEKTINSYKQFEQMMIYKKEIDDLPVYISNNCFSLKEIKDEIKKFGHEKAGLIIIDTLEGLYEYQHMEDPRPLYFELKSFAKQNDIPIVVTTKLFKSENSPCIKDIAEGQYINMFLDKILFLNAIHNDVIPPFEMEYDTYEMYEKAYNQWILRQERDKNKYEITIIKSYKFLYKKLLFSFDYDKGTLTYLSEEDKGVIADDTARQPKQQKVEEKDISYNISPIVSKPYVQFNQDLLNTDMNLKDFDALISKSGKHNFSLCLYGASGTGKTAYANHLAEVMRLNAITKRCSDILKSYIGETESKIAEAFREARIKKSVLIFDEADSFLQKRSNAVRFWEITQVNEMLTQMEKHPYPVICTTNLMENIDEASLRRFTFKIKYDYMTNEQIKIAFEHFFNLKIDENCDLKLTPGDFNVVHQKAEILGLLKDKEKLLKMLKQEQEYREPTHTKIGFI